MASASDIALINALREMYKAEKKEADLEYQAMRLQPEMNAALDRLEKEKVPLPSDLVTKSEELAEKITQAANERSSAQRKVDTEMRVHRAAYYKETAPVYWRH